MANKTGIEKMLYAIGDVDEVKSVPKPPTVEATTSPEMPYKKGEFIKSGEKAKFWTGSRPWQDQGKALIDRATKGSPPYTDDELKQGYRKVG